MSNTRKVDTTNLNDRNYGNKEGNGDQRMRATGITKKNKKSEKDANSNVHHQDTGRT